ncbi:hypothetical protein MOQ_002623 [Trypanosoma cruzi marinkellei]|uniref:Uncharacterized protein n=1 Tax=Trypanosoma cruzi marinkellei TaxID=85056 RepID=K2N6B4_TRYCR|nr:hypothetical protein MOQ_002623 [Trypanosoma cruzi marinkellei]
MELKSLENDIDTNTRTLRQCEEALDSLFHKELQLREGLEGILMEMHDLTSMDLENTIKNNSDGIASLQQILMQIRRKREQLHDQGYRLHIKLQCLKAEKRGVAKSTNMLLSRLLGDGSIVQSGMGEEDGKEGEQGDDDDGSWRAVVHSPPVLVSFIEEYREKDGP